MNEHYLPYSQSVYSSPTSLKSPSYIPTLLPFLTSLQHLLPLPRFYPHPLSSSLSFTSFNILFPSHQPLSHPSPLRFSTSEEEKGRYKEEREGMGKEGWGRKNGERKGGLFGEVKEGRFKKKEAKGWTGQVGG